MERNSRRLSALSLALAVALAGNAQAQVVISQVYGGGGNSGATIKHDFIELHNNGSTEVSLAGWSVQYASNAGTTWTPTLLSGSIRPGGYYLIRQGAGSGGTIVIEGDATGSIAMSGSAGKVALVKSTTALSGACPGGAADLVGYGTANCFEGSAAAPGLTNTTAAIRIDDGCTDTNVNRNDFLSGAPAPRNSGSAARPCAGGTRILASIADASVSEGNTGTQVLAFTVTLTAPAGADGVSFRYTTADGTATAGTDYVAASGRVTIPAGETTARISIEISGDATNEPDETLRVELGEFTGAEPDDVLATGTILNDDFPIVPIANIQGAGDRSPLAGTTVATRGIVTGVRRNGFFIQSREIDADADPATSEGLFVFTSEAPPAFVTPGRWVIARGFVAEYVPSTDPGQQPVTELTPTYRIQNGKPVIDRPVLVMEHDAQTYALPAPVTLTASMTRPDGGLGQLEHLEAMRVTVPEFVVTAPTGGSTNERTAEGSSNGLFHGVIAGIARPFREPGIEAPDAPPAGSIPPIPRWDGNPELLTVDSDALGAPKLDLSTGARIAELTGPLDYGFRRFTILPDPSVPLTVTPGMETRAAKPLPEDAFTVAAYNLERFYDETADAGVDDEVLTGEAFERRLNKASIGIRDSLRMPDILGVVEMENLGALQRLATRINADAAKAGQPDPKYTAHLLEGNDVGGIDVGFLVKTADTGAGTPRVEVKNVVQIGKDTTWMEPDGDTDTLNDRPPLLLDAVVHYADGRAFPLNVVIVHQRSLIGTDGTDAKGERARAKRQRQAEFLAAFLDARQKSAPDTRLVVLGDFNAFEFNDGLVHAMGTVTGEPAANEETAVPGDGNDLVEPNLVNLGTLEPKEERYSFVFGGNAQTLDHVLVNEDMVVATRHASLDHARINADFPEVNRSQADSPSRLADHDPVVAYFVPRRWADLGVDAIAMAEARTGGALRFDVTLANAGPEQADRPAIGFDIDAALPDLAVAAPSGWGCEAPRIVNGHTLVTCSAELLVNGGAVRFELSAPAGAGLLGRTVSLVSAVEAQSLDRQPANNSDSAQLTVTSQVDLSAGLDGPDKHLRRGAVGQYRAEIRNLGPDLAVAPVLTLRGNAPAANVVFDAPQGWACAVVTAGTGFSGTCRASELAAGATQAIEARITGPQRHGEPHFTVHAAVSSASTDANAANDAASHHVVLTGPAR